RARAEVVPGYADRILPKGEASATELRKRTLTNLYNQRPAWLDNAHRRLDEAVAAAYGWPADLTDAEILKRLFDLNLGRAARQSPVAPGRRAIENGGPKAFSKCVVCRHGCASRASPPRWSQPRRGRARAGRRRKVARF